MLGLGLVLGLDLVLGLGMWVFSFRVMVRFFFSIIKKTLLGLGLVLRVRVNIYFSKKLRPLSYYVLSR